MADPVHRTIFCEVCWAKGFGSPGRVVVELEDGRHQVRCILCHCAHEAQEDREREKAWTQTR